MITGIHLLLNSRDAGATRAFLRDALELKSVDAGRGWLIFALPPSELAVHPSESGAGPELYLMCDHIEQSVEQLVAAGAHVVSPLTDQRWGRLVTLRIPGGIEVGIYEPTHETALGLAIEQAAQLHKPGR